MPPAATKTRPKSDTPEAIRQRNYRDRKRNERVTPATAPTPDPATAAASSAPSPPAPEPAAAPAASSSPSAAPWHVTEVITGPGPEAFARPLVLPAANDNEPAVRFAPATPAPAEAPPPPLTAAQVAPIAMGVAAYFEAGSIAILVAYQVELAAMGIDPNEAARHLPTVKEVVRAAAEACAIKYRIRVPYQDELVVAGAIGIATFGMVKGRKRIAERAANTSQHTPTPAPPPTPPPTQTEPMEQEGPT